MGAVLILNSWPLSSRSHLMWSEKHSFPSLHFHFSIGVFYIIFTFELLTPHSLSSLSITSYLYPLSADGTALYYYEKTEVMRDSSQKILSVICLFIHYHLFCYHGLTIFTPDYNNPSYCSHSRAWLELSPFLPNPQYLS